MVKKHYIAAIVTFALIPIVTLLGGLAFNFINPEIAAGYPNYERNYRLLDQAKSFVLFGSLLLDMVLWFLTCFFLLKAKRQSYWWLPLAMLGPFGLVILLFLGDSAPEDRDFYHRFVDKLNIYLRIAYELCIFWVLSVFAFQIMVLKRELMIMYEADTTGISTAQIIDRQNASSGMWAFGEGLEVMYLSVIFYLLRPILFNVVSRLCRL
jgi:hypothetical protein